MKPLTKRQQQALATKQKIFKCAVSLFAQKAYENVTVNDICQQAQVSVGASIILPKPKKISWKKDTTCLIKKSNLPGSPDIPQTIWMPFVF